MLVSLLLPEFCTRRAALDLQTVATEPSDAKQTALLSLCEQLFLAPMSLGIRTGVVGLWHDTPCCSK